MTTALPCELQSSPPDQEHSRAQTHRPEFAKRKWGGKGTAMHMQFLTPKSYQSGKWVLSPRWVRGWNRARSVTLSNAPSSGWKYGVGRKCLQLPQHPRRVYPLSHCTSLLTRGVGLPLEERDITVTTWGPARTRPLHPQHTLLLCRYSWHHWPQKVPNWAEPHTN